MTISAWLVANDRRLWGMRAMFKDAVMQYNKAARAAESWRSLWWVWKGLRTYKPGMWDGCRGAKYWPQHYRADLTAKEWTAEHRRVASIQSHFLVGDHFCTVNRLLREYGCNVSTPVALELLRQCGWAMVRQGDGPFLLKRMVLQEPDGLAGVT